MISYRLDFGGLFITGALATVTIAYFLWQAVFEGSHVQTLRGFTLAGMVLYYLLVAFTERIIQGSEFGFLSQDIYDGSLTRYLLYPLPAYLYKGTIYLAHSFMAILQMTLGLGVFVFFLGWPSDFTFSLAAVCMSLVSVLFATVLYFTMQFFLECVAFWAENVWSLAIMLRFSTYFLGGAMIPIAFFPDWLAQFSKLTPFPYVFSFPVMAFLGKLSPAEWGRGLLIATLWIIAASFCNYAIWSKGAKNYTGVGI